MLGHARSAINDAVYCWPIDADSAEYNVQYWLANDGYHRNAQSRESMLFCLGLLERIVWNTFRVDCWRLSAELLDQSGGNVSKLVIEQHHGNANGLVLARPCNWHRDDDIHRDD